MEYEEHEIVSGDNPPGLETLGDSPNWPIQTRRGIGQEVIQLVYGQVTATSFDSDSAIYAA